MSRAVLLVTPPYQFRSGPGPYSRVADPATSAIVTYLRGKGIPAYGYLAKGTGPDAIHLMLEHVMTLIEELSIQIVGISANYMPVLPATRQLAGLLHDRFPYLTIVSGGSIVSGLCIAGEAEVNLPECDFLVVGDGEFHLARLATSPARFLENRPVVLDRKEIPPEEISPIRYDGIYCASGDHQEHILLEKACKKKAFTYEIINSRACPYSCKFCISPLMGQFRISSVKALSESVREIRKLGATHFNFDNNHFNLPRQGFNERMAALGNGCLPFIGQARLGLITPDEVHFFALAGGRRLYFGLESMDARTQKELGKSRTLDQVKADCDLCHRYSVKVGLNIILGAPGSTYDSDARTIACVQNLRDEGFVDVLSAGVFVPHPGTPFWRTPTLRIVDTDPFHWDNDSVVVEVLDELTGQWYKRDNIELLYRNIPEQEYDYCALE